MVKKAAQATPNHVLRAARKERNWTQKEVADRIGSPQSFNISRWEQGTAFPSAHYIQQLCLLFGKSARELGLLEEPIATSEPSTEADSPPLWNVPYRRNPFFTGREEVLTQLHERLTASRTAALTQTQAISGLGGIGKTQIAVEYAYRYRGEYRAVFWVRAASHETLLSDFVELANLLQLPGSNQQDQQIILTTVKRWLERQRGWLLILDNADDLDLVADFLPTGDNGSILLTTRSLATGRLASSIEVEKMSQQEGVLLLLRRAKVLAPGVPVDQAPGEDRGLAQSLVRLMDGLPLALDQAGAYIEETGCGLAGYLDLYHTHRKQLLQRRGGLQLDHPESVTATLALSFLKVEQANPAAADLLRLCAFLDPDAIPEAIFTESASVLGPILGPVANDTFALNMAMETLRKFSLLRRNPEMKILTIHRLVQAVLKDGMDKQVQRAWAEGAVCAVNAAFPEAIFVNWQRCQELLPHAQACAELIEEYNLSFPEATRLLLHAGGYARERALYAQAEVLLKRSLALREHISGSEHIEVAATLDNLGLLYREKGHYEQAEPLVQRALEIYERVHGPEHFDTAATLDNLACIHFYQGHYERAEALFQQSLSIQEKVLGDKHPSTADTLNNLAQIYMQKGQYQKAEPLYQQALAIQLHLQGPEHPSIAEALNNLSCLYHFQGHYEQSESYFQRTLLMYEHVFGSEHPGTALVLDNLAMLYRSWRRYEQAEPLVRRALTIFEQALGPECLDTAIALDHLAHLYFLQGRYEQAEPLLQKALSLKEKVLVPEHPNIAMTLDHLANLYCVLGQYEQAEHLFQRALTIFEQTLGPESPHTALVLDDLARFYFLQSQYEQSRQLYQQALTIREKVLGTEHPDTIAVRASYAELLEELKRSAEVANTESLE